MDERIVELLRNLAAYLKRPDAESDPISGIEKLGEQSVPLLIAALRHDDSLIRRTSAVALQWMSSPYRDSRDLSPAVPHLEQSLYGDVEPTVRMEAAEALWAICEHAAALDAFVRGLDDNNVRFRRWAAIVLGTLESKVEIAVAALINALDDTDLQVRRSAAESLAMHGTAAAGALPKIESLLGEDEWTRVISAQSILTIDPSRAEELVPVLANALTSRSRRIRHETVLAFSSLPTTVAMLAAPELIKAVDDEYEFVRMAAIPCIAALGAGAAPAVSTLVRILRGEGPDGGKWWIRQDAADALGAIGEHAQDAAYYLLECLHEPGDDPLADSFRLHVAFALWRILGEPQYFLNQAIPLLKSPDSYVRAKAVQLLGGLGGAASPAIPALRQMLEDESLFVRRVAAKVLDKIGLEA